MRIQQNALAYEIFIQVRAEKEGKSETELQSEISPEQFETRVRELHDQWMNGAFSFGKFTELIDVPHWELWEILDALGLSLHR